MTEVVMDCKYLLLKYRHPFSFVGFPYQERLQIQKPQMVVVDNCFGPFCHLKITDNKGKLSSITNFVHNL